MRCASRHHCLFTFWVDPNEIFDVLSTMKFEKEVFLDPMHPTSLPKVKKNCQDSTPFNVDSGFTPGASNDSIHGPGKILHILVKRRSETSGLGLSIAGGNDSPPYKGDEDGIYVSNIVTGGPCDKAGLKVDDKIVKVNRRSFVDISHSDAVQTLFQAGNEIKFTVLRPAHLPDNSDSCDGSTWPNIIRGDANCFCFNNESGQSFSFKDDFISSKTTFKPMDVSNSSFINPNATGQVKISSTDYKRMEKNFKPEAASTSLVLSNVPCGCVPDEAQPASSNALVQSSSYKLKSKHEAPVIKISIQNPRPYIPLGDELPPVTRALGKTNEILTKSSFSEKTLIRQTCNSPPCNAFLTEEVAIERKNGSLGLSIMGGVDQVSFPFGAGKPGVFVSKLQPNGSASISGKIRVGDRLLMVNGNDVSKATHHEAVQSLCAPVDVMRLFIQHDPLPSGWQEVCIKLLKDESLGVELSGGLGGNPVNPFDSLDEGIFITKIIPNSAAFRDGRLKVGMRVIEVCGRTLLGATIKVAYDALNSHNGTVSFTVCDGFDAAISASLLHLPESGSVTINSASSIDSDEDSLYSTHQLITHKNPSSLDTSVDSRVLDVVHAAERLVVPSPQVYFNPSSTKKKRTTTIVLSKHIVNSSPVNLNEDQPGEV